MYGNGNGGLSRPGSKAGRLQRALLQLIDEHRDDDALPTSGRFLWYELVANGAVDKTKARGHPGVRRGVDQDVTDALTHLRMAGLVDWADITDDSRDVHGWIHPTKVDEVHGEVSEHVVRLDPWGRAAPLVLVESRSAAGVLASTAYTYGTQISGLGGQVHGHLVVNVVPLLDDVRLLTDATPLVLYVGDLDLSGGHIEGNVARVLDQHVPGAVVERVALTQAQAQEHDLVAITKRDRRYNDSRPHEAIELEALGQRTLTALLDAELAARLPGPMREAVVRETTTREVIEVRDIV